MYCPSIIPFVCVCCISLCWDMRSIDMSGEKYTLGSVMVGYLGLLGESVRSPTWVV